MIKPIYVVAGNYKQFATNPDLFGNPKYIYINSVRDLMGLHGIKVLRIGTYVERGDFVEMEDALRQAMRA